MCNLTDPIYQDVDKAREHLEALRWPDGPVCPHCGVIDNAHEMTGKSTRPGLWKCRDCRKPFYFFSARKNSVAYSCREIIL